MFSTTRLQRKGLMARRTKSLAWLAAGFTFANAIALVALTKAASAATVAPAAASMEPAMQLAKMLAAPDTVASALWSAQSMLMGVVAMALIAMTLGSAVLLKGLKQDFGPAISGR